MAIFSSKHGFYKRLDKNRLRSKNQFLRDYYSAEWPSINSLAIDLPYTAIDIETSGLDPKKNEILSVGMVDIESGLIDMKTHYYQLVSPKSKRLDDKNVSIHHLTEADLANALPIDAQFETIANRLKGRVAIVHYSVMESRFLNQAAMNIFGEQFEFPFVDTLAIERRRYPNQFGAEPYRLPSCCKRYGLPRSAMHNAFTDALATAQLYLAQMAYSNKGINKLELKDMI